MPSGLRYDTETLRQILTKDQKNCLVLPDFQRDFVWDRPKQKKLLASLLVGLPIGSILIVKGKKDDFNSRSLCKVVLTQPSDNCEYLLDGQQRLSCLKSIFDDIFPFQNFSESWEMIYGKLRNRWFIKIKQDDPSGEDVWGYKYLTFTEESFQGFDPSDLEQFIEFYGLDPVQTFSTKFYHPLFQIKSDGSDLHYGSELYKTKLVENYAKKYLVPLYDIFRNNNKNSLHWKTLKAIAHNRQEELKALVVDGKIDASTLFRKNVNAEQITADDWAELKIGWAESVFSFLNSILDNRKLAEIILDSNEIDRAVATFEAINLGGTPLSTYDLIVAKVARLEFEDQRKSLTDILKELICNDFTLPRTLHSSAGNWKAENMGAIDDNLNTIAKDFSDQFLGLLSVLCYEESCDDISKIGTDVTKKKKILALTEEQVKKHFRRAAKSIIKAFAFLQYRCGIVLVSGICYELMILPIAYVFSLEEPVGISVDNDASGVMASVNFWTNELLNKLEYWYWLSLFSGRYEKAQNEVSIGDITKLSKWVIQGGDNPFLESMENVLNKRDYSDKDTLLLQKKEVTPPTAIVSGILQYILSQEPRDFILTNNPVPKLQAWVIAQNKEQLETHHIVPLATATKIGETTSLIREKSQHPLNSPLNLTYITKMANSQISGNTPAMYIPLLNPAAITGHQISSNMIKLMNQILTPNSNQEQESLYRAIIEDRFNTIYHTLTGELQNLINP